MIKTELQVLFRFRKTQYKSLSIHQRINLKSNFGIVTGFKVSVYNMPDIRKTMKYNN